MKKNFSCQLNLPKFEPLYGINLDECFFFNAPTSDREIIQLDGSKLGVANYCRYVADSRYYQYVENLIPELKNHIRNIAFQQAKNFHNHPNGAEMPVHTDGTRGNYSIQFLIESGGPHVQTTWYQEKGMEVIRQPSIGHRKLHALHEDLIEIESTIYENNKWGLLVGNVLHGVKGIQTTRTAFVIGFNGKDLYDKILQKYS